MRSLAIFAFFAALAFTLTMAWLPHPPAVLMHEDDKALHILAFITLSFLASLAFPAAPLARIGERLSFVGALIEIVQSIPALQRDCDIMDWIADTMAVAATLAVVAGIRWLWLRRRRPSAPSESPRA
jgi:hypothetical protein